MIRKRKTKGNITRAMVIEKSLQLFSVRGFFNTSVNEILKATHLTKGGLYSHFPSKKSIWYATYDEAVKVWQKVIFHDMRQICDPVKRLEMLVERHLKDYIGGEIFEGGCFFLNMLIEASGQSDTMSRHLLNGFTKYTELIEAWIDEAKQMGRMKDQIATQEIGIFIVTSFYGAAALYSAGKDPQIWKKTIKQLHFYIKTLTS